MPPLIAGIDISSRQLDACLISLDKTSSFPVGAVFRQEQLPSLQQVGHATHARMVARATHRLLLDVRYRGLELHEVVQVVVEEAWGPSRRADRALLPTFGAVLAAIPVRCESFSSTTSEWRRTLGLSARLSKSDAIHEAGKWLRKHQPDSAAPDPFTEHMAEALLIARAGRKLCWDAEAAA